MSKKLALVNGFKVPEEWYALVQRIATERKTTVGGAIQIVFELGLPLYEKIRTAQEQVIEQHYRELHEKPTRPAIKRGA